MYSVSPEQSSNTAGRMERENRANHMTTNTFRVLCSFNGACFSSHSATGQKPAVSSYSDKTADVHRSLYLGNHLNSWCPLLSRDCCSSCFLSHSSVRYKIPERWNKQEEERTACVLRAGVKHSGTRMYKSTGTL